MKSLIPTISALISVLSLTVPVSAHMALISPPPLRHKSNPHTTNPDYSYTSPITASQFPCKGYHSLLGTSEGASVANYSPGGTYQIHLEGSATHNGGSCQISLSYDKGKSFQVIKSIIGGCVKPNPGDNQQFSFTIPRNAGGGEALLAWSWINNTGNREFYMNCAVVTIGGKKKKRRSISGTAGRVEEKVEKPALGPNLFVANLGNGCTTLGGTDVDYPDPGPNVERGPSQKVAAPVGQCGAVRAGGGNGGGSGSCDYYRGMGMYCASGAAGRTTGLGAGLLMTIAASAMLY
ncbi:extracellular protein [Pyronema omphalodes]|nr:extracellular protein [Pyronema omphalodes]